MQDDFVRTTDENELMTQLRLIDVTGEGPAMYTALVSELRLLPAVLGGIPGGPFGLYLETDRKDHEAKPPDAVSRDDKIAVAKALIFLGCRSFWFSGASATEWEDAADVAAVDTFAMSKARLRVVPHDVYRARGEAGGIITAAVTLEEIDFFFRCDHRLPPDEPLKARVFATLSQALERRIRAKRPRRDEL